MGVQASGNQPDPQPHRTFHDWETSDSLAESIVQLLAELNQISISDMRPLYESIDLEHAEAVLVDPQGTPREDVTIEFTHAGYEVTIRGFGEITATPASRSDWK